MTSKAEFDPAILPQFTGTEHWYRHSLVPTVMFTDGAKYVADTAGAYWLLDEIALAQRYDQAVTSEEFQLWELKVARDATATLTCDDGNGHVVYSKKLEFTDFPAPGIKLYHCNGKIFLPSEYWHWDCPGKCNNPTQSGFEIGSNPEPCPIRVPRPPHFPHKN